ncbi:GAF and ANTAR domain-containing protein [Lentzea aerocolonigenes]|uniref:GAF and ANTAR domain-containing protein n=1 Tax=Lentzea aerocolonigenes TaxID=68170 RepID=UPI001F3AECE1|nr:GAF and ANTAR domain-containing protein [Lentzea aerocolonigenes]MCP2243555.1 GAF domain-containing protein [Lentzea aerocolonigenes]
MPQQQPVPASRPAGPVSLNRPEPQPHGLPSEHGVDGVLSRVVHELYAAGLDLHTVLGLVPGHRRLAEERVRAVITRLDDTIRTIHQAGGRLAMARTAPPIDALIALPGGIDLGGHLYALTRHCVELLGLAAAAIVLNGQDVAASGQGAATARELCRLQEGPCHDTCRTGQPVTVADLAVTSRWPLFTAQARTAGFQVVHTLPLSFAGTSLGALALFNASAHEPSAGEVQLAQGVADFAAVVVTFDGALRQRDSLAEQLRTALFDHAVVEQAKGVLAERHGISVAAARTVMITHSHLHDAHLIDTAQAIVDGAADLSDTVRRLR